MRACNCTIVTRTLQLCVDIVIVVKHVTGILFSVQFDGFMELHALTLVARSYALLR